MVGVSFRATPNCHLVHGHRGHVEHMEEGEPCLELLCQGNGIFQCPVCSRTKINGDEHVLNDHRSLLKSTKVKGHRYGTSPLLYALRDTKTSRADVRHATEGGFGFPSSPICVMIGKDHRGDANRAEGHS